MDYSNGYLSEIIGQKKIEASFIFSLESRNHINFSVSQLSYTRNRKGRKGVKKNSVPMVLPSKHLLKIYYNHEFMLIY